MIDLRHGDCLELMRDIPGGSVDLVLCDPPYGIDYQSARRTDKTDSFPKILNDKKPFIAPIPMIPRLLTERGGGIDIHPVGRSADVLRQHGTGGTSAEKHCDLGQADTFDGRPVQEFCPEI